MLINKLDSIWDEVSWGSDSWSKSSLYKIQSSYASRGFFDSSDAKDYYQINLGAGTYKVSVTTEGLAGNATYLDFDIKIVDGSGNVIYTADSIKPDIYSKSITFTLNASSTLYTEISNKYYSSFSYIGTIDQVFTTTNYAPLLSSFGTSIAQVSEDVAININYNTLAAAGNEIDDGSVESFVIKSVLSGTLTINGIPWSSTTNNQIGKLDTAIWIPAPNSNGLIQVFTAVAKDNQNLESSAPVSAKINVIPVNDSPAGSVLISGSAIQGQTLSASNTLADADGLGNISYQWKASGVNILGATGNSYTLTSSEVGKSISITASYTDAQGTLESVNSSTTALVTATSVATDNDIIVGTSGNDTLNGGLGNDTMIGGDGSDTYYVESAGDVVTETNAASITGGTDLVLSSLSAYTLTANVENGRIYTSTAANITGNTLANTLYAGAGNNTINGDTGTDTVSYQYATAGVTVNLSLTTAQATGGSGTDTLLNIENLAGTSFADTLTGTIGANVINGGAGADNMAGGTGNDIYYVDNIGDVLTEASTGGTDTAYSTLSSYTLGNYIENGRITASGVASLTGNTLNNVLYAGVGNNTLDGSTGVDTVSYLYGLVTGSTVGVTASLLSNQVTGNSGTDTLIGIENLTGSSLADTLTGNTGNNVLDGGLGNDTLIGGLGNDTYVVNSALDVVTENFSGGTDTVNSLYSGYTLSANIENGAIMLTTAADITGNDLPNTLYAGAGNNTINGGLGTDTVSYLNSKSAVTASLAITTAQATGGSGSDTFTSIENLTGSAFADNLAGNQGSNVIDGGAGSDTMTGGDGSDIYYLRDAGDVLNETNPGSAGGSDTVYSYLSNYALGTNIENVRIILSTNSDIYGNDLNNLIYAGIGNNIINGGNGVDTVSYQYSTSGLAVSLDTTASQNTYGSGLDTLSFIENLIGSSYGDTLVGDAGNNKINGGLGSDYLVGGDGLNTFVFDTAISINNVDYIQDFFSGYDKIALDDDIFTALGTTGTSNGVALSSTRFYIGTAASDADDRIIYDQVTGYLYYDPDGIGSAAQVKIALIGQWDLAASDFLIIA